MDTFTTITAIFLLILLGIYIKRKDLIIDSLISGVLMLIIASITYILVNLITPDWVYQFWYFSNFPKMIILDLPIDDIIFYFLFGATIAPLYEYWLEGKIVNKK
jgi:multisubunit Na+/H+ antiporter MnhB subunit